MTRPAKPDRQKRLAVILLWGCITASAFCADSPSIAPTPPMGWNSWDSYGTTVGEGSSQSQCRRHGERFGNHGQQCGSARPLAEEAAWQFAGDKRRAPSARQRFISGGEPANKI
jgi:hypothetical protein